jgi:hypothetical protein
MLTLPSLLLAQEEKKDTRPERAIAVYPEYSGVIVTKNEAVRMDLIMDNGGRKDESMDVTISGFLKAGGDVKGRNCRSQECLCRMGNRGPWP